MVLLSCEEKIEIVLIVGENYKTHREAASIFNDRHPNKNINHSTVTKIINKFKTSGSINNNFNRKRGKLVANENTQLEVMLSVVEHPKVSLRKRKSLIQQNVSKDTVGRILKRNKYRPFKPKIVHTLKERDYDRRFDFCSLIQGELEDDPFFPRRIIFSDEATFSSNGTVSSQHCRWWSEENPNFTIKSRDQYSFKTNVWCGIYKDRLIGPYFFHQSMNAERYLQFLQNQINDFMDELPLQERQCIWFQQDGATCHSTLNVREYLEHVFNGKVMHRYSDIFWPARSPDLTPLDYFLWGYLKQKVYQQWPFHDVNHLERIITQSCREISPEMIRKVLRNFANRTMKCIEREGGYVEALVE